MKRAIAVFGLSSLLAMSAHADLDVRASISGLSFELIDLDPSDGISPSITFGQGWGNGSTYLYTGAMTEARSISFSGAFPETSRSLTTGPASSEIKFEGIDVGTFATRASIHSSLGVVAPGDRPQEFSGTEWHLGIELSPRTELRVSAIGKVEANSDLAIAAGTFSDTSAFAKLSLYANSQFPQDQIAYSYVAPGDLVKFSETRDKTLSVSLSNGSSSSETMDLQLQTWINHSITPIPEPSTSGLVACGLLLLGGWTRARRVG